MRIVYLDSLKPEHITHLRDTPFEAVNFTRTRAGIVIHDYYMPNKGAVTPQDVFDGRLENLSGLAAVLTTPQLILNKLNKTHIVKRFHSGRRMKLKALLAIKDVVVGSEAMQTPFAASNFRARKNWFWQLELRDVVDYPFANNYGITVAQLMSWAGPIDDSYEIILTAEQFQQMAEWGLLRGLS